MSTDSSGGQFLFPASNLRIATPTAFAHQPQYLPWLGYFDKLASCDVFILLDNVQFKKNEWQNRNKIRVPNGEGWQWITVPVLHDFGQKIDEVQINNKVGWRQEHVKAIELNYGRATFFKVYWPQIKEVYQKDWSRLCDLNCHTVKLLANALGIKTKIVLASELSITSCKTERLIELCKAVGADAYLAGAGASHYMDFELFESSGIKIQLQEYQHPTYDQVWMQHGGFLPFMSVIDLLFNEGPRSLLTLTGQQTMA